MVLEGKEPFKFDKNGFEKSLENIKKLSEEKWKFYGKEQAVVEIDVDNFKISCEDSSEVDYLDIIGDFYHVEAINCPEGEDSFKFIKIANYHRTLLRLKWFYKIELKKCLEVIGEQYNNSENVSGLWEVLLKDFELNNSKSKLWEYVINKLSENKYDLERLFLLSIVSKLLLDKHIINREGFLDNIHKEIENVFKVINNELKKCQENIFLLKCLTVKDLEVFGDFHDIEYFAYKVENILEKNKKNSKLYEKFNCFATMVVDNRKYITINGVKDESLTDHPHKQKNGESGLSHLKVAFKELLGKKSTYYVGISDLTRYYTENLEYITYKEFKENKDLNNLNRMFTCCEKKLFAKLSELSPNDKKITLTITRPPCPLCKRAIEALREDNKYELIIKCGESELTKEKLDEMDNVAKKILEESELTKEKLDEMDNVAKNFR